MTTPIVETTTTWRSPVTVTSTCDFNVLDALTGKIAVMLVHAVNGGYLKPDALDHKNNAGEARSTKPLDKATIDTKGHLWYLTPAIFDEKLNKMTYFIESAASEGDTKRRRITHHPSKPTDNGIAIGSLENLPPAYQFKQDGNLSPLNQCWIAQP